MAQARRRPASARSSGGASTSRSESLHPHERASVNRMLGRVRGSHSGAFRQETVMAYVGDHTQRSQPPTSARARPRSARRCKKAARAPPRYMAPTAASAGQQRYVSAAQAADEAARAAARAVDAARVAEAAAAAAALSPTSTARGRSGSRSARSPPRSARMPLHR